MAHYLFQLLLATDQLINALIGGWADETLSSRAYRSSRKTGSWRWRICQGLINGLFFNRTHCFEAFESERCGSQLPPEFRFRKKN